MAFDVQGALKEGYSYSEIAAHLSKQNNFDLSGAQKEGYSDEEIINHLISKQPSTESKEKVEVQKPVEKKQAVQDVPTDEALANAIPMPTTKDKIKRLIFGDYTPSEAIKRQLGLTGRHILEGGTSLLDLAAMPVRGTLNTVLPEDNKIPTLMAGETVANKLNLPVPQSPLEKIVGKASNYLVGAGSAGPLKYITPTTTTGKAIQTSLIEDMPLQLMSGATAGAAAGAAEEAGAGVIGQTTSSLAGGFIPFVLSKGKIKPKMFGRQTDEKSIAKSEALINKYQIESAKAIESGVPIENVRDFVNNAMGISDDVIRQAAINKNIEIPIPKTKEQANSIVMANRLADLKARGQLTKLGTDVIQPLETRLQSLSTPIFNRLRQSSINNKLFTEQYTTSVKPFMQTLNSLPEDVYKKVTLDLYNGNFNSLRKTLVENAGEQAAKQFDVTQIILKAIYKNLEDAGYKLGQIKDYFPRGKIKDLDGLYSHLEQKYGYKAKDAIEKALENKAIKLKTTVSELPEEETAKILNNYLKGYGLKSVKGTPSFTKQRQIQEVTEDMLPYFNNPIDSLDNYIRSAVNSIEQAKFFGKNNLVAEGRVIDTNASVGNLLARTKGINTEYLDEMQSLLRARFNAGEQSPMKIMQMARDISYMTTLANPISALTQTADSAMSIVAHGFKNTIAKNFNTDAATMERLGFDDIAADLTSNPLKTSKILDKMLSSKLTMFKAVDRFGKNKNIRASLNKARNMLSTVEGEKQLRNQYGGFFGDRFDQFAADLKRGNLTADVKAYAISELANLQPIFAESLPRLYLQHPNGRLMYALQSFTLKQLDWANRNIRQVWKSGNKKEAIKRALVYYGIIVGANTGIEEVKKLALNKEVRPEDIPTDAFFNLLKMFGVSRYVAENKLAKGDIVGAVGDTVAPAALGLFNPIRDIWKAISSDDMETIQSLRMIPILGPFLYNWFGGGLEKYEKEMDKKKFG